MTGTGVFILAGVLNVSSILTVMEDISELSTWPISFFVMAGT